MIYVVLGMHKSGTTLVARLLHESGIDMGCFDPALGYSDGNTFERHATQAANRVLLRGVQLPPLPHLLRRMGRSPLDAAGHPRNQDSQAFVLWKALERRLGDESLTKALLDPVIQDCQLEHDDWGFKDPRTCLTYEAWRRHLPEHRVIAVYRSLGQVMKRSCGDARHPFRALRVVRGWTLHNRQLLRAVEASPKRSLLLRYERLMSDPSEIERLAGFVNHPLQDVRDPALHRSRGDDPIPAWVRVLRPCLPADPFELERRLENRIQTQEPIAIPGSQAVPPP